MAFHSVTQEEMQSVSMSHYLYVNLYANQNERPIPTTVY
jgi:hypothetical protein